VNRRAFLQTVVAAGAGLMTPHLPAVESPRKAALDAIGYRGWMIAEQFRPDGFDDADWLRHLSQKMDRVFAS
jgi:hypothetical protein